MNSIDRIYDLSLRSDFKTASGKEASHNSGARKGFRPVIREDFVIPHVGSKISDGEVLDFAERLADQILGNPYRAVGAQANQDEDDVNYLTN